MGRTRPALRALRALREDLKLPLPPLTDSPADIPHPLPAKADEQFADENTPHERIRAIDDEVLFKIKIAAAEQIWSNLMDPAEATKLLADNDNV